MDTESNNNKIHLELSDRLKKEKIVNCFFIDPVTHNIVVEFNHKYEKKKVISRLYKDWNKTIDTFERTLEKKGIPKNHILILSDELDNNYESILKLFSDNNAEEKEQKIDILNIVRGKCSLLFVDQNNIPYSSIIVNGHHENISLNSTKFRNWVFNISYHKTGETSSEEVGNIINTLKAEAEFSMNLKTLDLRVAKTDNFTFYYDLTNSEWSAIKITPEGWTVDRNPPILFKRYNNQRPQIFPSMSYLDDVFNKFMDLLNIKNKDIILLLKCYIISLFIPEIAKPILMVHGEQGSSKTTFQELIKMLVDPSILKTLSFPRDINELIQKLSHNYIAYFDNISEIKDWISDELCRAVTGSGSSKRQLYTDDDDVIYNFKRCIGFNGINLGATKADLLDRGIIIQLERIAKEARRKIENIWKEFETLRCQLLGYIFDIIVKYLQVKQNGGITISNGLNRMADFEESAEIISRCMGYTEGEFLKVYEENIGIQIDEAIEASPLAVVVIRLLDSKQDLSDSKQDLSIEGTATELLSELENCAVNELKMNICKLHLWPKAPNALSHRLNEIRTNLREKGITIEKDKDKHGNKIIKIWKISSGSTNRQTTKNQAQNSDKVFGDVNDDTREGKDNIDKTSPTQNEQNQEQNNSYGRSGDVGDDLHTNNYSYQKHRQGIYPVGHTDKWACEYCNDKGDKFYMRVHQCRQNKKNGR